MLSFYVDRFSDSAASIFGNAQNSLTTVISSATTNFNNIIISITNIAQRILLEGAFLAFGDRSQGKLQNGEKRDHDVSVSSSTEGYKGEWQNGKFHGHGVFKLSDGYQYEGEWQNGEKHGHGVLKIGDGYQYEYEGKWQNNKKQGLFTIKKDEDSLELEFKNDVIIPRNPTDGITIQHIKETPSHPSYALIVKQMNERITNTKHFLELKNRLSEIAEYVIIKEVDSVSNLTKIKFEEEYINRVSYLWISAHGSPSRMQFGETLATIEDFKPLLNQLAPSALIVLASCSTGKSSFFEGAIAPIAKEMSNYLQTATVIAPNCNIYAKEIGFAGMNNGTHTTSNVAMLCVDKLRGQLEKFSVLESDSNFSVLEGDSNYSACLIENLKGILVTTAFAIGAFYLSRCVYRKMFTSKA